MTWPPRSAGPCDPMRGIMETPAGPLAPAGAVPARPGRRRADGPDPPGRARRVSGSRARRRRRRPASRRARRRGAGRYVPAFASLDELLAAGDVDGRAHRRAHRPAPRAGHGRCWPPDAGTVREAVRADRRGGRRSAPTRPADAGLVLQVAYWRRFVPELVALRQQIPAASSARSSRSTATSGTRRRRRRHSGTSSGGIFVDMGVHEFDQVRWLTGQEFGAIGGRGHGRRRAPVTPTARSSWPSSTAAAPRWSASAAGTRPATPAGWRCSEPAARCPARS